MEWGDDLSMGEGTMTTSRVLPFAPPRPRKPIVAKMCLSCPFGPNAGRPKLDIEPAELEAFKTTARLGEFYCHETVLEDPRTKRGTDGDPDPKIQPHFQVCRGGWELKLKHLRGQR